jgi:ribosomal protein S18 acetylase RimI-like enzyme
MRIRSATVEDATRIAEIHIAAWRAAYAEQLPKAYLDGLDVIERAARWRRSLAEAHRTITAVAIDEYDEPMAFCVYGLPRDADARGTRTGEIMALNVVPTAWRRGFGAALLDGAMRDARRIGWERVTLWVLKDNQQARGFYEKYGFSPDGAEKTDSQLTGTALREVRYAMAVP